MVKLDSYTNSFIPLNFYSVTLLPTVYVNIRASTRHMGSVYTRPAVT